MPPNQSLVAPLVSEQSSDLPVPGINRSQHLWHLLLHLAPKSIGYQGLGGLGRVQTVHWLNQLPSLTCKSSSSVLETPDKKDEQFIRAVVAQAAKRLPIEQGAMGSGPAVPLGK